MESYLTPCSLLPTPHSLSPQSAIRKLMNLWGGRFTGETDKHFAAFNASFNFDRRLIFADLQACAVHARALGRAGVLKDSEVEAIIDGLKKIGEMTAEPG